MQTDNIYAFILGNNKALSLAELAMVLKREEFIFVVLSITATVAIIKTDKNIFEPQKMLDRMGGIIKIIQLEKLGSTHSIKDRIFDKIKKLDTSSKIVFGISGYDWPYHSTHQINGLGINIKKNLAKARFVNLKEKTFLSSAEINRNQILKKGLEICLLSDSQKQSIYLGQTLAIQNYLSYGLRDYKKPQRDTKSGMLPPKLAQIMINLGSGSHQQNIFIYDPFCGTGTILVEGLLSGHSVMGSDSSPEAIRQSKENIDNKKLDLHERQRASISLFVQDAQSIDKIKLPQNPNLVISELYLGPPLNFLPSDERIKNDTKKLIKLYLNFLKSVKRIHSIKTLVLAMPYYNSDKGPILLDIIDEIDSIGYTRMDPLRGISVPAQFLAGFNQKRKTLLYAIPDQIVGREIIILKKYEKIVEEIFS